MPIDRLEQPNADYDLTANPTVFQETLSETDHLLCVGLIALGDIEKPLDGTGGDFELTVIVGGQTIEPSPQVIECSTATRTAFSTGVFPVPANAEVIFKVKSPNAGDTDVDVTASVFDALASGLSGLAAGLAEVHLVKAAVANNITVDNATGVHRIKDDDGSTTLRTMTPAEDIAISGANWTNATKRLSQTGAFTNYIHEGNTPVVLTAGTGVVAGQYTVTAKIDDDTIELAEDINGTGSDISDNSVVGTITAARLMVTAS